MKRQPKKKRANSKRKTNYNFATLRSIRSGRINMVVNNHYLQYLVYNITMYTGVATLQTRKLSLLKYLVQV